MSDHTEKEAYVMLLELEQKIQEAVSSGTTYRPEYRGFDLAIYEAGIRPLIDKMKNLELYANNNVFKAHVDILVDRCEEALTNSEMKRR